MFDCYVTLTAAIWINYNLVSPYYRPLFLLLEQLLIKLLHELFKILALCQSPCSDQHDMWTSSWNHWRGNRASRVPERNYCRNLHPSRPVPSTGQRPTHPSGQTLPSALPIPPHSPTGTPPSRATLPRGTAGRIRVAIMRAGAASGRDHPCQTHRHRLLYGVRHEGHDGQPRPDRRRHAMFRGDWVSRKKTPQCPSPA